jgi:hypothetical protein
MRAHESGPAKNKLASKFLSPRFLSFIGSQGDRPDLLSGIMVFPTKLFGPFM